VKISFVAGFGPIVRDVAESRAFWGERLGIDLQEAAPDYWTNDDLAGVRAYALWPLSQAAESTFGTDAWILVGITHTPWMHGAADRSGPTPES